MTSAVKRKVSFVWDFFKELPEEQKVLCRLCNSKMLYSGSTSAMGKHLKNVHKKDENNEVGCKKQPTLTSFGVTSGRTCDAKRQENITKLVASMIARHHLPLEMVEWPGFRELVAYMEPSYKPVYSDTIKSHIEKKGAEMKADIAKELGAVNAVAITTDAWTSCANDGYLAVTASYVNAEFEIKTPVLATVNLTEKHSSQYLEDQLGAVIEDWNISGKVVAVVHDNAANIAKVASHIDSGVDIGCGAHTLQLCITEAMGLKKVSNHPIQKAVNAASHLVGHFSHR
jgi:zinc finger BED domain-containing protein 1 (E3 SUMO-protein ligase ZBED1)